MACVEATHVQLGKQDGASISITSGVETPPSCSGRMKENVMADNALRDTAMSASSLSAMSFELPSGFHATYCKDNFELPEALPVSSSSSTCTRESDGGNSEAEHGKPLTPVRLERAISDQLNAKLAHRTTSRQGRSSQRWVTESNEVIRLVTGCVPILKGGKILLVSAGSKPEWILPKGGWEKDEPMEESALRETFEEAGVFGVLGPMLKEVQYETRKAKKRRLEMEELLREQKLKAETEKLEMGKSQELEVIDEKSGAFLSKEAMDRIRAQTSQKTPSETSSGSFSYSQVRMTLFPLYVSSVMEEWPESGRFRMAVDIDEAIKLMEIRPELRSALQDVKERGLHLLHNLPSESEMS